MKNLVLRNLFKLFRLAVTLASLRYVPTNLNCVDDANKGQQAKVLASERRWCSRPEFMPLETSYSHCDELGILRDSRRLDRAELPYDAAHGSPHDLPNCFMPVSTTVVNMREKQIDTRSQIVGRRRRTGTKNAMCVRENLLVKCFATRAVYLDLTFLLSTTYFMNSFSY